MTENEQNPDDFLNRLLIENFKNLCSFSSPANKINNWLLTVVGFSISIFFLQSRYSQYLFQIFDSWMDPFRISPVWNLQSKRKIFLLSFGFKL